MYKIKNFRLSLNKNTLWRHLKSKYNDFDDGTFDKIFAELIETAEPSSIYETLTRESAPSEAQGLFENSIKLITEDSNSSIRLKDVLAVSYAAVNLGDRFKKKIDEYRSLSFTDESAEFVLNAGMNFIVKLLKEDAVKEDCIAEKKYDLNFQKYHAEIENFLNFEKIGIKSDNGIFFDTECMGLFCVPWLKKKKK